MHNKWINRLWLRNNHVNLWPGSTRIHRYERQSTCVWLLCGRKQESLSSAVRFLCTEVVRFTWGVIALNPSTNGIVHSHWTKANAIGNVTNWFLTVSQYNMKLCEMPGMLSTWLYCRSMWLSPKLCLWRYVRQHSQPETIRCDIIVFVPSGDTYSESFRWLFRISLFIWLGSVRDSWRA